MVRTSPFVDATAGGMSWSQRLSGFFILGAQGGVFIARRVRVVGRIGVFAAEAEEESYGIEGLQPGYRGLESGADPAVIVWGGSVGYALGHSEGFALSPSLTFLRTDVARHGSFVGLTLPFEWATRRSLRIGFEVTGGVAVGGTVRAICDGSTSFSGIGSPSNDCVADGESMQTRDFTRKRGSGFYLGFQLGWGLGPQPENQTVTSAARK
jgi:hypothetical protein